MKYLKTSPRIIAALAAAMFSSQLQAATPIWNAAGGGNWSVNGNWSTGVFPQTIDDVQFGNVGAGNQNTMDAAFTINSLVYNQDNGLTHTTLLNPGLTLSINRTTTGDPLTVASLSGATTLNTLVPVVIQGPGAALSVNGTGDIVIRQGNGATGSHMATLDLSGLDTFTASVGHLLVGVTGGGVNRPSGTLILAKTNTLTLNGPVTLPTLVSVMVQDSTANANGGTVSLLTLGQVNFFYGDQYRFGGQKGNGTVQFNPAFSNPSFVIRNVDQVSRATALTCGDNSLVGSGNGTVANVVNERLKSEVGRTQNSARQSPDGALRCLGGNTLPIAKHPTPRHRSPPAALALRWALLASVGACVGTKPGAGPRHVDFHPSKPNAYAINELDSTITTYRFDGASGELKALQVITTLPPSFTGNNTTSEIAVAPSGRFVYGSNRGHDSIAVFAVDAGTGVLTPVDWEPTQGKTPRFFTLDPSGRYLYAANQDSDTIVCFRVDPGSGKLSSTGNVVKTGSPSSIVFV